MAEEGRTAGWDSRAGGRRRRAGRRGPPLRTVAAAGAGACLLVAVAARSDRTLTGLGLDQVQQPFDRQVDIIIKPLWLALRPFFSLANYILLSPVRLHLRVESLRAGGDDAPAGKAAAIRATRTAAEDACQVVRRFARVNCPEVLVVRGAWPRIATFPLGAGRKWIIVVTEALAEQLQGPEVRFAFGREIGHVALGHGPRVPRWALGRFAADTLAFPRYVASRLANGGAAGEGRGRVEAAAPPPPAWQRQLLRSADGLAELCELYRGIRHGRWPGLADLDLDTFFLGAGGPSAGGSVSSSKEMRALDATVALCSKLRAPGGLVALSAALAGISAPWLLASVLGLDREEERRLRTALRLSAWALGVSAGKLRTEALSADRLGLLAAGGDLDAAVRAMVRLVQDGDSAALAALVGVSKLVEQAETLDRALPRRPFDTEPSLPTRVADLAAWARTPEGRAAARRAQLAPGGQASSALPEARAVQRAAG